MLSSFIAIFNIRFFNRIIEAYNQFIFAKFKYEMYNLNFIIKYLNIVNANFIKKHNSRTIVSN